MSSTIKKIILVSCFGFAAGALMVSLSKRDPFPRDPASSLSAPEIKKGLWEPAGKYQRSVDIKITPVHGTPKSNDQELTLKAEVTLLRSLGPEVEYKWVLPAGATVVGGETEDSWTNLKVGQTATAEISLLNVSHEDHKIVVFQAFGVADGVKLGGSGVFATGQEVAEAPASQLKAQGVSSPKTGKTASESNVRLQY